MEKIYEALDSITKRLGNPFLLSFCISWLVSNWKAVLIVVSSDDYLKKFNSIELLYAPDSNPDWRLVWWPLIAAFCYVIVMPLFGTLATGVGVAYDSLNDYVRSKLLRLRMLSLADSQALQDRLQATISTLVNENDSLSASRIGMNTKAGEVINSTINKLLSLTLSDLRKEAPNWPEPRTRLAAHRSVGGTAEQEAIIEEYGLPEHWLEIFKPENNFDTFSAKRAAILYEINEGEAMDRLLRLAALNMLRINWVDTQFIFSLYGGRWGALLNGRPAS